MQQDCLDGTYFVEDSVGDLEQIHRSDMITDEDDADNVIKVTNTRYEEGLTLVLVYPIWSCGM